MVVGHVTAHVTVVEGVVAYLHVMIFLILCPTPPIRGSFHVAESAMLTATLLILMFHVMSLNC